MSIHDKYKVLQQNLKDMGSVAVAFSSGVDSTFLLKAALEALGKKQRNSAKKMVFVILSVNQRSWILMAFDRIRRIAAICASMNCLKKSGRLQKKTA